MTDQPERLSTDGLPPGCPAWAGALFGELALESDLTSYRVVEVLGLLEATTTSTGASSCHAPPYPIHITPLVVQHL